MTRDENGREWVEKPLNHFRFYILLRETGLRAEKEYTSYGNRQEMDGNWKLYQNALLFNRHSPCMNITLHTLLCKLFFQNMIKASCFICLNS